MPQSNERVDFIEAAFIALDSEKLGEHVNDSIHVDFGDNKFPYFLGNKKNKDVVEDIMEFDESCYLSKEQIHCLKNIYFEINTVISIYFFMIFCLIYVIFM